MIAPELVDSFGRLAANHLWQSTAFAAAALPLALALRGNHARVRYWLWLAASLKFLVPFALLEAIGRGLARLLPAAPASPLPLAVGRMIQPFTPAPGVEMAGAPALPAPGAPVVWALALLGIWVCGMAAVLLRDWVRWRQVAAAVRSATPLTRGREWEALRRAARNRFASLPRLVSSNAWLEPGAFGVCRPVLWLPAGIADHLGDAELEAILAHELCHIRRRDGLTAAIHMAVETFFWFHPLVWWLGARMIEERERACDEEVVRLGGEPQVYAESILKVCEFYLASPVACAAGMTGGDLKRRIEAILTNRFARRLSYGKKALLASAAVLAVAGPVAVGAMRAQAGGQPSRRPEFEVVSVKVSQRSRSGAVAIGRSYTPGTIALAGISAKDLIARAYALSGYQISGPDWLGDEYYDVMAKAEAPVSDADQRLMLRAMLASRFSLAAHAETRELSVYEMLVAKGGPKIHEAVPDDAGSRVYPNKAGVMAKQVSMTRLAELLSAQIDRPVLDRTSLSGVFDIDLQWANENAGPAAGSAPSVFTAIHERLGLRLQARKAPVEVLVIDHMEKVPSAN